MDRKTSKAVDESSPETEIDTPDLPMTERVSQVKVKTKLPKRLAALCLFFTVASISGIVAKQGVLFCILTLLMVVAILGRQRTAMYMLQAYTVIQLGLISMLPVILYDPDNLVVGNPSIFKLGGFEGKVPDYLIFALLILLSMLQVWIAFTPKVRAYFNSKINLNIMN
ncbi:MAG: hypothetical protein ACI8SK_000147 [Shewanella sp.]